MKLNLLNKAYIALAVLLVIATTVKIMHYKSWERFHYFSSVSAPSTYPIYITNIGFEGPSEDFSSGFYKSVGENVNRFNTEWGGEYYFAETYEPLRLPEKLILEYVSYRDKQFYSDTLILPQKKMLATFKSALKNKNAEKLYSSRGDQKGLRFVVGVANNGNIIIWLRGVFLEQEIFRTKIKPHEPSGDETVIDNVKLSKTAYLKKIFEELPDSVKTKLDNGFDAKANYIDSATNYIENNKELWEYQKENKFID